MPTKSGEDWVDITEEFKNSCSGLALGQLAHDAMFSLFEAMSAIEMMDPKMDGGIKLDRPIMGPDEACRTGLMPLRDINTMQLLGIMDETLAALVTWFDGDSLAQTVYINMYLHVSLQIENRVLKAFCLGIQKLVEHCATRVNQACVGEEEDFNSLTYGFCDCELSCARVGGMLKEADDDLQREIRNIQRQPAATNHNKAENCKLDNTNNGNGVVSDLQSDAVEKCTAEYVQRHTALEKCKSECAQRHTTPEKCKSECVYQNGKNNDVSCNENHVLALQALQLRLRIVRNFLSAYVTISRLIASPLNGSAASAVIVKMDANSLRDELRRHCTLAAALCKEWPQTLDLGQAATGKSNPRGLPYGVLGFEPLVNQRLLPPTFPRYSRIVDREVAAASLAAFAERLLAASGILDSSPNDRIYDTWLRIQHFGQRSDSCILSRSIMQLLYLPPNGRVLGRLSRLDTFRDSLRYFLCLTEGSAINRLIGSPPLKDMVDQLTSCATQQLFAFVSVYGLNRSRQRDRIGQLLAEIWLLYEECYRTDKVVRQLVMEADPRRTPVPFLFSTFCLIFLMHLTLDYLLAGFQLDLYACHEAAYVYAFIGEGVAYYMMIPLVELEKFQTGERAALADTQRQSGRKQGRRRAQNTPPEQCPATPFVTFLKYLHHLCMGYLLSWSAFVRDEKMSWPEYPFGSEELRYTRRFAPLLERGWLSGVGNFHRFRQTWAQRQQECSAAQLYSDAGLHFEQAREIAERCSVELLPQRDKLQSVLKHNCVVLRLLASGHKCGPQVPLHFDFSTAGLPAFPQFRLG